MSTSAKPDVAEDRDLLRFRIETMAELLRGRLLSHANIYLTCSPEDLRDAFDPRADLRVHLCNSGLLGEYASVYFDVVIERVTFSASRKRDLTDAERAELAAKQPDCPSDRSILRVDQ